MKRKYETPNMEMIEINTSDVIVCSNEGFTDGGDDGVGTDYGKLF